MIGAADIAVLAVSPLAGYATDRWVARWDRRLGESATDPPSGSVPALVTLGLSLAIAVIAVIARGGAFALVGAGLGWALLALALVDRRHQILPDTLTLPLIVAGLLVAAAAERSLPAREIAGALAGFGSLALCRWLYERWRGREGLGLGDAKLLAAGGAWLGWAPLPLVILLASLAALVVALPGAPASDARWRTELPFGPYLALAIWALWLYGPEAIF